MSQGAGTTLAGPTPRRLSALALALAPWLAGACAEEEDPLSAEVLQQIGRSQGDAVGSDRAGVYLLAGDAGPCDCPEVGGLDLCGALAFDAPAWPAQVYQHEGLMVLDIAPVLTLYGRLDADGAFVVAAIRSADSLGSQGEILGRVDGAFDGDTFSGELRLRLQAEYVGQDPVDCGASSSLSAQRL
ncbi:MAG: hypothetical protein KC420_09405 [Myxococcales bacterium]|nr:hypothetical protein [Myxococcales bacterium]MCB9567164.1 hypothetical protein [Myxococcales bacterium]MCB9704221.1 hypothetical protein [Myxococcales bacterium]